MTFNNKIFEALLNKLHSLSFYTEKQKIICGSLKITIEQMLLLASCPRPLYFNIHIALLHIAYCIIATLISSYLLSASFMYNICSYLELLQDARMYEKA